MFQRSAVIFQILKEIAKALVTLILVLVVIPGSVIGWISYQRDYVCQPAIEHTIERFTNTILATPDYNALEEYSMFIDQKQFEKVRQNMSNRYMLNIYDWDWKWYASVHIKYDTGAEYRMTLAPRGGLSHRWSCWGVQYRVAAIR